MDLPQEKAQKAERVADAVGNALAKTLTELRSDFAFKYDLDDQLITLAIAKAGCFGYDFHGYTALFEHKSSRFQSQIFDCLRRR